MPDDIKKLVGVILAIVALLCMSNFWPSGKTNTEKEVYTNYGTAENEDVDFDKLNQIASDLKFKIGTNNDQEQALQYANGNTLIPTGRSRKLLYFDLISPVRGNFTESAAQYAVQNCSVDFSANAKMWVDMLTAAGLNDDMIKEEMSALQFNGGGFTNNEIDTAFANRMSKEDAQNTYTQGFGGIYEDYVKSSDPNDYSYDSAKCEEMLSALLTEGGGFSYSELVYLMNVYGGYDDTVAKSTIANHNPAIDFGAQAQKVAKQYKSDNISKDDATTLLSLFHAFPTGETKWAINQTYTDKD